MDYICHDHILLGKITMASDGEALTGLWYDDQAHFGSTLNPEYEEKEDLPVFDEAKRWMELFFRQKEPDFTPKLNLRGTPFQQKVWNALLRIPFGEKITYGRLAARLHMPVIGARAVGNAVARNPVAIIVPCHRVVRAGNDYGDSAGGRNRKFILLEIEHLVAHSLPNMAAGYDIPPRVLEEYRRQKEAEAKEKEENE